MSKVKVEFYNMMATIARLEGQLDKAQKWLDNEVLKDCQPYVPMRSGNLMNSGVTGTTIGKGEVVYNAPYARRMYYGTHFKFSKAKHPQACAQWFEKAKSVNSEKWEDGVQKIVKG
jgi:hypothetical protein